MTDWISITEAAHLLGIAEATVVTLCADGKIRGAVGRGSKRRIPRESIALRIEQRDQNLADRRRSTTLVPRQGPTRPYD